MRELTCVELKLLAVRTELGDSVDASGVLVAEMLLVLATVVEDGVAVELSPGSSIPFGRKGLGVCSVIISLAPGRMKDVSKLTSPNCS